MHKIRKTIKLFVIVILFYPLIFLVTGSIMSEGELLYCMGALFEEGIGSVHWTLIPQYPTLTSYIELLFDHPEFYILFWNTVLYTVLITTGQLLVALPAAWGLYRIHGRFKHIILVMYFVVLVMPFQVKMLPEYLVLLDLNLLDTRAGIILPELFSPLPVWILYGSFSALPNEIVEIAQLDGASNGRIFFKICLPNIIPGIVTCVILSLLEYWNMLEQPLLFLKNPQLYSLSMISVQGFDYGINIVFALSVFVTFFLLLTFLILQKKFENGISYITKE